MKKITSFLLILTMLISIIYLPEITINISADEQLPGDELLPGEEKLPGSIIKEGVYTIFDPSSTSDAKAVPREVAFENMKVGGKYYLEDHITLSDHTPMFNNSTTITEDTKGGFLFDGGGYTIKTDHMIFAKLPPETVIGNFIIEGTRTFVATDGTNTHYNAIGSTNSDLLTTYKPAACAYAPLCGKFYGGTVKNILNKANVHVAASSDKDNANVRISGLIGTCFWYDVLIQNCENRGYVIGRVGMNSVEYYTMGGILAYSGLGAEDHLYVVDCKNTGYIKNYSSGPIVAAGGVVGYVAANSPCQMVNCENTGTLTGPSITTNSNSKDHVGKGNGGCTQITQDNIDFVAGAIAIDNAEDFLKVKGDENYYVRGTLYDIPQNKNEFIGTIYGFSRTMEFSEPPFADMTQSYKLNSLTMTVDSSWTKITTADQFKAIDNSQDSKKLKYYLGNDIDLPSDWTKPTEFYGYNSAQNIILDGCGYTITTSKPIFPELPGGAVGNDGTHSTIRNLKIKGNVTVNQAQLKAYDNGKSIGALVGKSNGGIYENIVNNASVAYTGNDGEARVGGIIGSVWNDDLYMYNCTNEGAVSGSVSGSGYGVGGVVALIGYNERGSLRGVHAELINCKNTKNSTVRNNSTADSHVYAGGVIGVKYHNTTIAYLVDCSNEGKIYAKTAYGHYMADRLQQGVHVIKTIPISNAEEFAQISGNRSYSLVNDISIDVANSNEFNGFFVGNRYTVTTPDRLFDNANAERIYEVTVDPTNFVINGQRLDTFKIVAANASDTNAVAIKDYVKANQKVDLTITTDTSYSGNAIYVNLGNQYYNDKTNNSAQGATRFGFDYEQTSDGFHVYLDGKDTAATTTLVNSFLATTLPKISSGGYDYYKLFGDKNFNYSFKAGYSTGLTLSEETSHGLADGVRYIEKTYTNSSGASIKASIIVIKSGANAHLEVVAAKQTHVASCTNSEKCKCEHVLAADQKTVSEFAADVEKKGKDVIAAVNGGYFMLDAGCLTPWGAQIVDGTPYREPWGSSALGPRWFGILNDGTPLCGDVTVYNNNKGNIKYAVNGKYYVIKNGSFVATSNNTTNTSHDARTMIGYNEVGDIVIIAVAGNNNDVLTKHPGVTLADVAQMFMDLDMDITYALNLDGGGSTAMVTQSSEGELVLRTPQYSNANGSQRKLTDALVLVMN